MPETTPDGFTVAIEEALVLHAPPVTASDSAVVAPAQTVPVPVIVPAVGNELTVIAKEVEAVPQPFVMV